MGCEGAGEGLKLKGIERDMLWITVAMVGSFGLWAPPIEVLSVAIGGLVMLLNLYLWRVVVGQALRSSPQIGRLIFKMALKSMALLGVTAALLLGLRVHLLAFLVGSTNLLLSVVLAAIKRYAFGEGAP